MKPEKILFRLPFTYLWVVSVKIDGKSFLTLAKKELKYRGYEWVILL